MYILLCFCENKTKIIFSDREGHNVSLRGFLKIIIYVRQLLYLQIFRLQPDKGHQDL